MPDRITVTRKSAVIGLALSLILLFTASTPQAQKSKSTGQARSLKTRIASILQQEGARNAFWGIQVISVRDDKKIYGWNEDKLFVPASTAKLFTTAAALVRLGPDFIYSTSVEASAPVDQDGEVHGDLILFGRGDPNLSARVLPYAARTERTGSPTKVFEELADQVWASGIRAVDGDLIVDDRYFVNQPYGQDWTVGDLVWGYGTPVSALSINDNVITLHALPGEHSGDPAIFSLEPMGSYYEVENHVVTTAKTIESSGESAMLAERKISVDRPVGSRVLVVWGQIPENDPGWTESVAINDPSTFAGTFFQQELARHAIVIKGNLKVRHLEPFEVSDLHEASHPSAPPPALVIASHQSAPLIESLTVIAKVSQNLHAEMLLRTLGQERRHLGSVEAGLDEVDQFLQEAGVPVNGVALHDGSGLSRRNLVSPSAMVELLRGMYNSKYQSSWIDLLPVAGVDGSLAQRLRGRNIASRVHAKTGSLAGVASLAGYILPRKGSVLAFAIFVNHHMLTNEEADGLVDRIVEEIAKDR